MPLKVSDGIGAYIDDFQKSDAPQFKGKSKKERRDMAIAAYLTAKRGGKPQEENVKSADRKPEIYTKPDGKKGVRMVATDREVVKTEAYTMGKPVEKKKKDVGEKTYMRTDSKLKNLKVPVTRKKGKVIKPEFKLASAKREALDAKDKPFVKDLIKKLRGGSKVHAKQADDLEKAMNTEALKVGSTVKPTKGPHAGHPHEVIHDFGDGHYNIKPKNMSPSRNKYRMGATKANIKDLKKESVDELSMYTSKKLPNLSYPKKKTKHEKERDRLAMMKKNKQKSAQNINK